MTSTSTHTPAAEEEASRGPRRTGSRTCLLTGRQVAVAVGRALWRGDAPTGTTDDIGHTAPVGAPSGGPVAAVTDSSANAEACDEVAAVTGSPVDVGSHTSCDCDSGSDIVVADGERGMATAEYAIATVAAAGFAGLLVVILRSGEVRELLLGIIRSALSL